MGQRSNIMKFNLLLCSSSFEVGDQYGKILSVTDTPGISLVYLSAATLFIPLILHSIINWGTDIPYANYDVYFTY